jgi:hypothetical protein
VPFEVQIKKHLVGPNGRPTAKIDDLHAAFHNFALFLLGLLSESFTVLAIAFRFRGSPDLKAYSLQVAILIVKIDSKVPSSIHFWDSPLS